MMYKTYLFYIVLLCLSLPSNSFGQRTETFTVIARPSHLIRTAPDQDASAISGANSSVVYGGTIKVSTDRIKADTLEGIPGYWREVTNSAGQKGYMFDGYLMKKGRSALAADQLSAERHERKIEGLGNLLWEKEAEIATLERKNRVLALGFWIGFPLLLLATLAGLYWLYRQLQGQEKKALSLQTNSGELNLDALAQELAPKINAQVDPKLKKISPNLIDLIQIQLKEFDQKISREYEKKSHVKTVKIKREQLEGAIEEVTPTPNTKEQKDTENVFGFTEDTALFSAYLHKGYQRRYLELPRNNLFFGRKATPQIEENSVYELCVLEKDPTRALFRMIDQVDVIDKALRFPHDYIFPVCDVFGSGNIQEATQLEYSYGIVVKDGPNWRIIQKAKLRYFLDEQLEDEEIAESAWQPTGDDITKTYYAVAPKNEVFNLSNATEAFESGRHVFRITITGKDSATYELVEDNASQTKAFHLPNKYLIPAFATLGQGSIYVAERAEMVQAGELTLEHGAWKISKKGIIQFFK